MEQKKLRWVYLITLSIIWGSSFILIKKGLVGLTPTQLGALRIVFTTIFLGSFGFKSIRNVKPKEWKWLAWSGFFGSFFPPFLFALAQTKIDSSIASILNSLTPLNTVILGVSFFGFIITRRQVFGVLIGLIGTVILISKGGEFSSNQNFWYSFLIIIASLGYALNINILKKHLEGLSALAISVGHFVLIGLPAFIILIYTGFFNTIFESKEMQIAVLYVLILSFFGTAIAKLLFNKMIKISSPVFAASVTYTIPLTAVLWGILDGENISLTQLLGGVIILLGVYLANRK
jgi:drug/metabolite transporter (DMT)-like permease